MSEPITVAELRAHARIDPSETDAELSLLITAARREVERRTGRALVPKTIVLKLAAFPSARRFIELPRPIVRSLTSIAYVDENGVTQTWASSGNYTLDARSTVDIGSGQIGQIDLDYDIDWPSTREQPNAVTITYAAGYAAAADVDARLKTAVRWAAAWWYEQRVPVNIGNIVNPLPLHFDNLVGGIRAYHVHADEVSSISETET